MSDVYQIRNFLKQLTAITSPNFPMKDGVEDTYVDYLEGYDLDRDQWSEVLRYFLNTEEKGIPQLSAIRAAAERVRNAHNRSGAQEQIHRGHICFYRTRPDGGEDSFSMTIFSRDGENWMFDDSKQNGSWAGRNIWDWRKAKERNNPEIKFGKRLSAYVEGHGNALPGEPGHFKLDDNRQIVWDESEASPTWRDTKWIFPFGEKFPAKRDQLPPTDTWVKQTVKDLEAGVHQEFAGYWELDVILKREAKERGAIQAGSEGLSRYESLTEKAKRMVENGFRDGAESESLGEAPQSTNASEPMSYYASNYLGASPSSTQAANIKQAEENDAIQDSAYWESLFLSKK